MNDFIQALKKWKDFSTRARRREYWMFVLFMILTLIVAMILDTIIFGFPVALFYGLVCLLAIVPSIAVCVRRLHDTGRSGWWYFIQLVPFIGGIWLFILMLLDSQPGTNQYGPNPKGIEGPKNYQQQ